ncbi:MAG: DUF134 domain-containing protein [Eubacteriales bacterium]|nr:DUF134 domain-containing protein [Eubacteriales bacterium]
MPRPTKWRRVCCLPANTEYGPSNRPINLNDYINMTVDEYETIRLIDLEELTQEECSVQMRIARTTVQRIYQDARHKIAESLVLGKHLRIEGGEYEINSGSCRAKNCPKKCAR